MTRFCADCGKEEPAPRHNTNKPRGPWRCRNCNQRAYRANGPSERGRPGWGTKQQGCSPDIAQKIVNLLLFNPEAVQRWRDI